MSVVIAVKKDDTIYFGADTQATKPSMKKHLTSGHNTKLFTFNNGVVVGFSGLAVIQQIVVAHPEWFDLKKDEKLTKEHINTVIIPSLVKALEPYDANADQFSLIIAYKSDLFEVYGERVALRIESKCAIGSGSDVIKYKLYNLDVNGDINAQILDALRFSAKFDAHVGAPFLLTNTKDLTVQIKED